MKCVVKLPSSIITTKNAKGMRALLQRSNRLISSLNFEMRSTSNIYP